MATRPNDRVYTNYSDVELGQQDDPVRNNADLDTQIETLQKDIREYRQLLRIKKQCEDRYKSASRDARKMYGDVTPGDTTHQDVTLEYSNHFKHEHRNLPKTFPDRNKYEVWQLSADIVQESFETNKKQIIKKVTDDLEDTLSLREKTLSVFGENSTDERRHDLFRALQEVIKNMSEEERKAIIDKVVGDRPRNTSERPAFELLMKAIVELELADYKSFVKKGELCDRIKDTKALRDSRNN